MIVNKVSKIVGLKEEQFYDLIESGQIQCSKARLIPLLKTGDEMALTSILLSAIRLIKEFRYSIYKDIKMPKSGKMLYLTEVKFPEITKSRVDGLIVVIKSGKIDDATIFEMKKENNFLDEAQIKGYIDLALKLKIPRLVTISNQFVSEPSQSPINIKHTKKVSLYHLSWTYIITQARILLFNDENIKDEDQIEIMKEVIHYFEGDKSGIQGYIKMSPEWAELTENILAHKVIRESDDVLEKAIISWYQEEKDMALKLSRFLGVMVKSKSRNSESIKSDKKFIITKKAIQTKINIKDSVSDILVTADFEKKNVKMSVDIDCPETGTNNSKVKWLIKQLESGKKKNEGVFLSIAKQIYIEADIKYQRKPITENLSDYLNLCEIHKSNEIKGFKVYVVGEFGRKFTSPKGFVAAIEKLLIDFYEGYVQHLSNWTKPAPKIERKSEANTNSLIGDN